MHNVKDEYNSENQLEYRLKMFILMSFSSLQEQIDKNKLY